MLQCNVFPGLPPDFLDSEVNLFLVPFMDSETESENPPRAGIQGNMGRGGDRCFLSLKVDSGPPWLEGLRPVAQVLKPFLRGMSRVGGQADPGWG